MRQSLQLRLGQQLTMTPQLQQAIRLLQLSTIDLQAEIQSVLESNLMLEKPDDEPAPIGQGETSTIEQPAADADFDAGNEALPQELPVDSNWEDIYGPYDGTTSYSRGDDDEQRDPYEQHAVLAESLREHLLWQMQLTPFSENDLAIAAAIIDAIGETGYLTLSLEEIHQGLKDEYDVELDEVEAVLHRVQRFDPPGIAARTPAECLLLQLELLPTDTPRLTEARNLIQNYLDLLAGRDFTGLMRRLKASREELQEIVELVQSLNPYPGAQLSAEQTQYIVPDVFVYKHKNSWRVELNPESTPRLRINPEYAGLVRRADSSADNTYLKNHLQEARWFLKSLKNRNETLLKVASCIVERQRAFLEHGEEYMKPLVLRDIAEAVNMHESTISRVTTQKYMHTSRGIYEFKYFFSSHVGTQDGGECSSVAIRAMIKKLVNEENPQKPLSDSKMVEFLSKEGIQVARRTVAKYREAMSIPSSTDRKRLT